MLDIRYQDDHLVAINKPHGLLVHRSSIAADTSTFALQLLRDQIGKPVYPAHRLDRKTSGVLLFSLDKETDAAMQGLFMQAQVQKAYWAIVRGYTDDQGSINYPLRKENGNLQEAVTSYRTLAKAEIDLPLGQFATSRYSLVKVEPLTGRMHQIRRHFAHIFHPIIGDRPHGCNKQNKLWKETFDLDTMLLHAQSLSFAHPHTGQPLQITADPQSEFKRALQILSLDPIDWMR
ncbi:pseudouridylate synthase [Sphingobacterium sp. SGG-5]|uniref:pseudouridine synthase n=1 Tax=Sphingobacterium sp. SGG-5 TaxID=2710881 RepID=UPI0013E9E9F8|nr:pseudouridine synthase [Sphingobacterium sp. SGG-5]NGM61018.1 pseudouridylate synthase [Sphingobacterium sp. SGG-5]